jgi:hypothetical protein
VKTARWSSCRKSSLIGRNHPGKDRPPTLEDLTVDDHGGWRPDDLSNFNLIACEGAPGRTCWLVQLDDSILCFVNLSHSGQNEQWD